MKNNKTITEDSMKQKMTHKEVRELLARINKEIDEQDVELKEMEERTEKLSKRVKYAASEVKRLGILLEEFREKQRQDELPQEKKR